VTFDHTTLWPCSVGPCHADGVGCTALKGSEVHLIPEGYTGPVVILYGVQGGSSVQRDEHGTVIYRIPPDGVLRLQGSASAMGFYDKGYFYEAADGTRIELPYQAATNVLQVFAAVEGVTELLDGEPTNSQRFQAYVVGVPGDRGGWAPLRDKATPDAIRSLREEKRTSSARESSHANTDAAS